MTDTKGRLFILSGPSGVGKSTVLKEVFKHRPNIFFSVSVTTRGPRPGEENGVHYHFISDEEYDALLEEDMLLEHAGYSGNRYGTPAQPIYDSLNAGKDVFLDIESVGMRNVKAKMPEAISVFIAPPDWETLEKRLRGRGTESEEKVLLRLQAAKRELDASGAYDYIVVNNTVSDAAEDLMKIMDRSHGILKGE
ncbi:MAG: guanylate kinase [Oscillospiraceae bacterium]|nr:guanylate kinase [Oscillospiraceae bacterium]